MPRTPMELTEREALAVRRLQNLANHVAPVTCSHRPALDLREDAAIVLRLLKAAEKSPYRARTGA